VIVARRDISELSKPNRTPSSDAISAMSYVGPTKMIVLSIGSVLLRCMTNSSCAPQERFDAKFYVI
jgi:hypothetical protein